MPDLLMGGLAWALAVFLAPISLYVLLLTTGSWMARNVVRDPASHPSVLVLVPAHDEEGGIARTVTDLLRACYRADRRRVLVIADNCSDSTASRARDAGAEVLERFDSAVRGEGHALDWALAHPAARTEATDIVVFVDADMYVHPDFLVQLAGAFEDPAVMAIQGRYTVANPCASWLAAMGFASFAYVNHVRPAGRTWLGGSAELKGSGMAFRGPLIASTGWPAKSIAEDVDFGKELLLRGIRVHYVPGAIVTSDIPSRLQDVEVQQSRWEGGRIEVVRRFLPRTLRAFASRPSMCLVDALMDLIIPPLSIIALMSVAGALAATASAALPWWLFLLPLAAFGAAVVSGLVQLRAPARLYLMLAAAPAFMVWKLMLLVRIMRRPHAVEWKRTPRDPPQPKK